MDATDREQAVHRLREESRRRIDRRPGAGAFSSWCALATLAACASLAALDAHEGRVQRAAAQTAIQARRDEVCARRATMIAEIDRAAGWMLAHADMEEQRAR